MERKYHKLKPMPIANGFCFSCKCSLPKNRKYCSKECHQKFYYNFHKAYHIKRAAEWKLSHPIQYRESNYKAVRKFIQNNRARFNELVYKSYRKNKSKCLSRMRTLYYIGKETIFLDRRCKKCHTKEGLQLHHEVYPAKRDDIINAVNNGQIYYLCKKCHNKHHIKN